MSGLVPMDDAYFGPRAIASANSYGGGLVDTCTGAFVGGCDNPVDITCDVTSWVHWVLHVMIQVGVR